MIPINKPCLAPNVYDQAPISKFERNGLNPAMRDESPLETIAQHLADLRQSIAGAGHNDWVQAEALSLLGRLGEIALYLDDAEAFIVHGSRDDYSTLIELEIRQDIATDAQLLVAELVSARLSQAGGQLACDVQKALIRANDRCGRHLAAIARAHIDAKGLFN